jgi:predicted PurR-regulated permease PerM
MFNLPGAFLWGFVGALASFIPFVGAPFIWIPTSVYLLLSGNLLGGLGFALLGTFISSIDNVVRPLIQKKVAQIHPFVSLLGIFVGFSLFGIIGIVLGPLLLSYFLLTLSMFKQEYIKD